MTPFSAEIATWRKGHQVGAGWVVNPAAVMAPVDSLAVRETNPEHVKNLELSFKKGGTMNESIEAVCVSDELWNKHKNRKHGIAITCEEWLKSCSYGKPMVFSGAHSRQACENLFNQFPGGHWGDMPIKGYVAPHGPETERMIRVLGNVLNRKNKVYLQADFAQIVTAMHAHLISIETQNKRLPPADRLKLQSQYKADLVESLELPLNSVNLIAQVAKQTGRLWELYNKVVTGDYEPAPEVDRRGRPKAAAKNVLASGKAHPMRSAHHLVPLMGMSTSFQKHMLKQVIKGKITIADMFLKANMAKARYRLQREACEFLQRCPLSLREADAEDETYTTECVKNGAVEEESNKLWEEAVELLPPAEELVERFIVEVTKLKKKEPIPQNFFDKLDAYVQEAENRQKVK